MNSQQLVVDLCECIAWAILRNCPMVYFKKTWLSFALVNKSCAVACSRVQKSPKGEKRINEFLKAKAYIINYIKVMNMMNGNAAIAYHT